MKNIDRLQARIDAQSSAPSVRFMAHLVETGRIETR